MGVGGWVGQEMERRKGGFAHAGGGAFEEDEGRDPVCLGRWVGGWVGGWKKDVPAAKAAFAAHVQAQEEGKEPADAGGEGSG